MNAGFCRRRNDNGGGIYFNQNPESCRTVIAARLRQRRGQAAISIYSTSRQPLLDSGLRRNDGGGGIALKQNPESLPRCHCGPPATEAWLVEH